MDKTKEMQLIMKKIKKDLWVSVISGEHCELSPYESTILIDAIDTLSSAIILLKDKVDTLISKNN